MNLTFATVLSCTDGGCQVQLLDGSAPLATNYSENLMAHKIPIRPRQFVIVDQESSPPETIFRFSRATVTAVKGEQIVLDGDGERLLARSETSLVAPKPGEEVLFSGYNNENRQILDVIIDGKPAHVEQLADDWFPQMVHYR